MDLMSQFVGHQAVMDQLISHIDRFPQTSIFVGESGLGKKTAALALAQKLICPEGGCGKCGACIRVAKQQSESLLIIEPESLQIKIERAREVIRFFALKGQTRVVIIDDAHLMNPQASNALLKTLEEPPEDSYLILITDTPYALMATIRSRSQIIRFGRLNFDELKRLHPEATDIQLRASQGVKSQLELAQLPEWKELRHSCLDFLSQVLRQPVKPAKTLFEDKETALSSFNFLRQFLRDWGYIDCGREDLLVHHDLKEEIRGLYLDPQRMRHLAQSLDKMERYLFLNVDRQLLFENLALELAPGTQQDNYL